MTLKSYLDSAMSGGCSLPNLLDPVGSRPPAERGVYVVISGDRVVYVGKTSQRGGLRDRIADFVSDAIGLNTPEHGRHSGGARIRQTFAPSDVLKLEILWLANPTCIPCTEHELYQELKPTANKREVKPCGKHDPALSLKGGLDD